MDKTTLMKRRQQLQDMKRQITEQLQETDDFGLERSFNDSTGELSGYDNHPADLGSELFERSKDMALCKLSHKHVEQIDTALKKIHEGTYGKCERCGQMIPDDRLEAMPESVYCLECSQQTEDHDVAHSRPIEEEVLYPGFLSEESWNDVERYGTSNDISMMNGETDYNSTYMKRGDNIEHCHIEYDQIYVDDVEDLTHLDNVGEQNYDYYEGAVDEDIDLRDVIEQYAYLNYLRQESQE